MESAPVKLTQGYVQVYTGNGKGKTTAALGQAIRAAGYGLKTYIVQFMKEYPYSELKGLKELKDYITIEQYGGDEFVYRKELPDKKEIDKARQGLARAKAKMLSGIFDIVILDEVCVAIYFGLFTDEEILTFIKQKPDHVEIILTGRYCPDKLIERAELVTEMKEIKHYYQDGIAARKGIES